MNGKPWWAALFGLDPLHLGRATRILVGVALLTVVFQWSGVFVLPLHVEGFCKGLVGLACAAWALGAKAPGA